MTRILVTGASGFIGRALVAGLAQDGHLVRAASRDPARNPAFDASKQWGERLDVLVGINFYVPRGLLKGNRFSIEGGLPLYQNIAGPNMAVDWIISAGWSYSF